MIARTGWVGILLLALAAAVATASAVLSPMEVTLPPWAAVAAPLVCIATVAAMAARQPIARLLRAALIALGLYGLAAGLHGLAPGIVLGGAPAAALDGFTSLASMAVGVLVACGGVAILARTLFPRRPAARPRVAAARRPAAAAPRLAAAAPRVDPTRPASAVPAASRAAASAAPAPVPAMPGAAPGGSFVQPAANRDARPVPKVTRAPEEAEAGRPVRRPAVLSVDSAPAVGRLPAARTAEPVPSRGVLLRLPSPPAPGGGWKAGSTEPIVRISFHRVADQLPPDACKVSLDEVAAGLAEPGVLLVPQRLLVPQLAEGVLQVAWEDLVDQMPSAVFTVPPLALKDRVTNGRLLLPVDEVVLQMPREVFALTVPVMDVSGIEEFSLPFGFGPEEAAAGRAAAGAPAGVVPRSPAPPATVGAAASAAGAPYPDTPSRREDAVEAPAATPRPAPASWGEILLDVGPKTPTAAAASPVPAAPARAPDTRTTATLRVRFDRIVPQLPAGAFRIPLDRVAANLLEPGHLLIPRRLVEPQIGEGLIYVTWEEIAAQFPPQSLALPKEEMLAKMAGGRIALPLDEVIPQLPPELFVVPAPRPDLRGLDAFPEPFQPGPPAGASPAIPLALPAVAVPAAPAPVVGAPASPSAAVAPQPRPAADRSVLAEPMAPGNGPTPAAAARAALIEEPASAPPVLAAAPAAVPVKHQVAPGDLGATPPAAGTPVDVLGRLAAALQSAGSFEPSTQSRDGVDILTLVAPGFSAAKVADLAGRVSACLGQAPASWALEQATVRSADGAVVITPAGELTSGAGAVVAVAVPRGGTLARVEGLCLGEGRGVFPRRAGPSAGLSEKSAGLDVDQTALTDGVSRLAGSLDSFGPLAAHVLRERAADLVLYLYLSPDDDAMAVGTFARDLYRAVADGPAPLGTFESVACRAGRGRFAIRRLPAATGCVAVLAVAGGGRGRPGLAHLQVERAATHLSSL